MSHIEYSTPEIPPTVIVAQPDTPIPLDRSRLRCVLYNARHMMHSRYANRPNWSIVVDMFGVGSSRAVDFCQWLGVDPDGKSIPVRAGIETVI